MPLWWLLDRQHSALSKMSIFLIAPVSYSLDLALRETKNAGNRTRDSRRTE